jgi:endonuclease/exonuclease/phosphatase family metal-dependent hydrolase
LSESNDFQAEKVRLFNRNITFSELREEINYRNSRKLGWINRIMLWLNYLAIISLILSYSARFINPATFWPIAFFGLAYPLLLIGNIAFAIYWFAQMRSIGLWSVLFVLLGWNSFFSFYQINFNTAHPSNKDMRVMSYNCMLFDLYNWSKNAESRNLIFEIIQEESPDILCLQEFYTSEEANDFNNADTLVKFLRTKYLHAEYTTTLREKDHWGVATLTKYPIVRKGKIVFNTSSNNICIYTDVLIDSDTVRIYNLHLASIHFAKKDYKFIDDIMNDKETEQIEGSKNILRRLKRGFLRRSGQAEQVAQHIKSCRYKVILCGDFNDTPSSYAYRKLKGELNDAFIESGNGIGKTYAGKLPAFRIDYILYSKDFYSYNYHRVPETYTDHYPISVYLRKLDSPGL